MKFTSTIILALLAVFILSCSNDKGAAAGAQQPAGTTPAATQQPLDNAGAAVAGAVKHYICPNNCEGSGGDAAGSCPVCGTEYIHNAAYHNQAGAAAPATQQPAPMFQPGQAPPAAAQPITPPQSTSPAQNAAGVYHYTCPKGCAGGSGSAGTCAVCGGQLAHNQAYHN